MNKIAIIILFAAVGAATYFLAFKYYPPFTAAMSIIPTDVTQLKTWFESNLTAIIPTAAGVGTVTTLLYNQVYKRAKKAQEHLTTQKISEVQGELLARTTENDALKQTNIQLQTKLDETKDVQATITSYKQSLQAKQLEVDKANERANEAERMFREKYFPKEEPERIH